MLLLERCDCDLGSLIYPKAGSEEEGQLSAPLMMKIATEMADGLAYLHSRGIKHLDMKPGNVLMVREGDSQAGACASPTSGWRTTRRMTAIGSPRRTTRCTALGSA